MEPHGRHTGCRWSRAAWARRELLSLHGQELARDDFVREMERAPPRTQVAALVVTQEHARPDHGVKDDVVLAHEVCMDGVRVLPPLRHASGEPRLAVHSTAAER